MPAAMTPSQMYANMTATASDMTIPFADTPVLDASEADPATGDAREVIRALNEQAYTAFTALAAESRPNGLNITKTTTSIAPNTTRDTYTVSITINHDPANATPIPAV